MKRMVGIVGGLGAFAGLRMLEHAIKTAAAIGAVKDDDFPSILYYNLPIRGMDERGVVDEKAVLNQLRGLVGRMESFGCEVIVMGCNSTHIFWPKLQGWFSGTMLNIVEIGAAKASSHSPVGVICSETTKASGMYGDSLGRLHAGCIETDAGEQKNVTSIILSVIQGKQTRRHSSDLHGIICSLKARGARSVILGCTELGIVSEFGYDIPVIDSGLVAVEAAIKFNG